MTGVITALKWSKRRKGRVQVFIDNRYAFTVEETLAASMRVGDTLDEEIAERLKGQDAVLDAYQRALGLISRRPRSKLEIQQYLNRRGVPPEVRQQAIHRLQESGYLDDLAFARAWIEDRRAFHPLSARALRVELKRKGVEGDTLAQALEGYEDESAALEALRSAKRRWEAMDQSAYQPKAVAFLARRGFNYDLARAAALQVWQEMHAAEEESEVET